MINGGTLFTMTYYAARWWLKHYNIMGVAKAALGKRRALHRGPSSDRRASASMPSRGPLATRAASGIPEFDELLAKPRKKRARARAGQHRRRRRGHGLPGARRGAVITGETPLYRRRVSHHRLATMDWRRWRRHGRQWRVPARTAHRRSIHESGR